MARTNQILARRIEYKMTSNPLKGSERVWVEEWKDYMYVGRFTNAPDGQKRFRMDEN